MTTTILPMGALYNGDCLQVLPTLEASSVDMVFADLPYGQTANRWDSIIPLAEWWGAVRRIRKPGAPVILTTTMRFAVSLIQSNLKEYRYDWVWTKPNGQAGFLNSAKQPLRSHEHVLVFCERGAPYYPQFTSGEAYQAKGNTPSGNYRNKRWDVERSYEARRFPRSYQEFPLDSKKLHPTQKPLALMEYLVRTYTEEGQVVLDPTMGSGTTCLAAQRTGRSYIGIEQDTAYYQVAVERMTEGSCSI